MNDHFNQLIDRRGTNCSKWDVLETKFDVPMEDGLAMWTADSDYAAAPCVIKALQESVDHGVFGYFNEPSAYHAAIQWWMKERHNWDIDTDWILTAQGLGNAIALSLDVWSEPGDRIVTFNPAYHEFEFKIRRADRVPVQCPLKREGDVYHLDLETAQDMLDGTEKILIFCSPQNPSGRVWTADELKSVGEFAERNDLIIVSDEVHHDFVYPGSTFVPMDVAAADARNRTVTLTAASKTFNIAGLKTGNLIIPDASLRKDMARRLTALNYSAGILGYKAVTAAYTPEGAKWADAQLLHLAEMKDLFDAGVNAIPGVRSLPLSSTYLAWVDFSGTGMNFDEISHRVRKTARIAPSPGPEFGPGGETFLRFNLATQRPRIEEAVRRLQDAFSDLQ